MAKNRLTREGLKKYEDELNYLKLTRKDENNENLYNLRSYAR